MVGIPAECDRRRARVKNRRDRRVFTLPNLPEGRFPVYAWRAELAARRGAREPPWLGAGCPLIELRPPKPADDRRRPVIDREEARVPRLGDRLRSPVDIRRRAMRAANRRRFHESRAFQTGA